nr:hypothetical protein OG999_02555 [Streptomyces sp. NBC_00886]
MTDEQAVEEFLPAFEELIRGVARQRGFGTPTRESLMQDVGPGGVLHVGSPETVARRIADTFKTLDAIRFNLKYGITGMPHGTLMTNIELYGTKMAPLVRELMESRPNSAPRKGTSYPGTTGSSTSSAAPVLSGRTASTPSGSTCMNGTA